MIEESLDPRPSLASELASVLDPGVLSQASRLTRSLAEHWDERQGDWTNLGNVRHWLARSPSQ